MNKIPLKITILLISIALVTASCTQSEIETKPVNKNQTTNPLIENPELPNSLKRLSADWDTNWSKHIVPYDELISGGPPRDGIPSIDEPKFVSIEEAQSWLKSTEPVISLEVEGTARAYPLQILMWHEIVNDSIEGQPVLVTFCPLCNAVIVFDRRLNDQVYEFGTSGLLRNSDLVMYDRATDSLWQQFTGEAIVGDLTGDVLNQLPSSIVSFEAFQKAFPKGKILSKKTGFSRNYGQNPYSGYDRIDSSPFLFDKETDSRLLPMERVITVSLNDVDAAYPLNLLSELGVIEDILGNQPIVVFYQSGTNSALDSTTIAEGRDVGSTGAFDSKLEGEQLTYYMDGDLIKDHQTDSTWNVLGQATSGSLSGKRLTPIVHANHFWFAWAAFKPDAVIYQNN
jgi:hypothetical protein